MLVTVSDKAAERLTSILADRAGAGEGLRILAQGGGCACSGGSFAMGIDAARERDRRFRDRTLPMRYLS